MTATASRSTSDASSERRRRLGWGFALACALSAGLLLWPETGQGRGPRSVVGTPHDLSLKGIARAEGRVCAPCHTSHRAVGEGPLWALELPKRPYMTYGRSTLESRGGQPDGESKLCLSCHDGLLASSMGGGLAMGIVGRKDVGSDLTDDHPVSFVYDGSLALRDGGLVLPEQAFSGLKSSVSQDLLDPQRKVQCTSCHDVHDNTYGRFLRIPNDGAKLCRTCHEIRDYRLSAHQSDQSFDFDDNCMVCHRTHQGERDSALLTQPETQLCGRCHPREAAAMRLGAPTSHSIDDSLRSLGTRSMTCSTCHEPHMVRAAQLHERRLVSDPDDRIRPRQLLEEEETPHGYRTDPHRAVSDDSMFCLDCHDGSWPGATNIKPELASARAVASDFAIGARSLHMVHSRRFDSLTEAGVGCTYCHDVHGTNGNAGIPRGSLLYEWLTVREFPYRTKGSCSGIDILGRCHQ